MEPTQWTRITGKDLDYVVSSYWDPIHRFMKARLPKGAPTEDLTQELFLRFIDKNVVERADPDKGSFRNFLFHIARQFLYDYLRKKKREPAEVDGLEGVEEEKIGASPEAAFEAEWYRELVHRARRRIKKYYVANDQELRYRAFRLFYFGSREPGNWNQARIAEELRLPVHQVNNYVARARKLYASEIQQLVGEYCPDPRTVQTEIAHLAQFLGRSGQSSDVDLSSLIG